MKGPLIMMIATRAAALFTALCCFTFPALGQDLADDPAVGACDGDFCYLDQGWTTTLRNNWYTTSQGSRLLPLAWMQALEQPGERGKFLDPAYMSGFGYLAARSGEQTSDPSLPLGFVADLEASKKADIMCGAFPEICKGRVMRQEWLGMTCAACHTTEIVHEGKTLRIDGAPTHADFYEFLTALNASLRATANDEDGKFGRFANAVLGADDTPTTRSRLKTQLGELVAWQSFVENFNKTDAVYGPARLDAQGYILNKIVAISNSGQEKDDTPADAPASYPFVWNTSQQQKIQWNGIAANQNYEKPDRTEVADYGAMVRNTSEVIGVFAHIETRKKPWIPFWPDSYKSSVRDKKLDNLERWLTALESPRWPATLFGEPTPVITANGETYDGAALYAENCASCHAVLAPDEINTPLPAIFEDDPSAEKFIRMSTIEEMQTDLLLACNTYLHESEPGNFSGRKTFWIKGAVINEDERKTANMLTNATLGALLNKAGSIIERRIEDVAVAVFGRRPPRLAGPPEEIVYLPGVTDMDVKRRVEACLTEPHHDAKGDPEKPAANIRAYKARPLNGVWATAPYLHNGSVPTLYDLLLPSRVRNTAPPDWSPPQRVDPSVLAGKFRPEEFYLNFSTFDAERVGYGQGAAPGAFKFEMWKSATEPIPGNYNSGHDYGVTLNDYERKALVEYLKTL